MQACSCTRTSADYTRSSQLRSTSRIDSVSFMLLSFQVGDPGQIGLRAQSPARVDHKAEQERANGEIVKDRQIRLGNVMTMNVQVGCKCEKNNAQEIQRAYLENHRNN